MPILPPTETENNTYRALNEMAPADIDAILAQDAAPVVPLAPHEKLTVDVLYWAINDLKLELGDTIDYFSDGLTPTQAKRNARSAGKAAAIFEIAKALREAGRR